MLSTTRVALTLELPRTKRGPGHSTPWRRRPEKAKSGRIEGGNPGGPNTCKTLGWHYIAALLPRKKLETARNQNQNINPDTEKNESTLTTPYNSPGKIITSG
jgi:hypothetical protein